MTAGLPPLPPPTPRAELPPGTRLCGYCTRPLHPHQKVVERDGVDVHGPCGIDVDQAREAGERVVVTATVEIRANGELL